MTYLTPTYFFDYNSTSIQKLIKEYKVATLSDVEKTKLLYIKIRDNWRYNPYHISFHKEHYTASYVASKSEGHCIDKAILLIACLRGLNIPARIQLAKVKNHIGTERFVKKYGTNEISPHGLVSVFLNNTWIKISPAFNKELCFKCNVDPLEFDGVHDSIFQEFDKSGSSFMEYIEDYGHFEDLPLEFIFKNFEENYPEIMKGIDGLTEIVI